LRIVDLRSDTVTLPTEEMLEAIRTAKLGDDVYREDRPLTGLKSSPPGRWAKKRHYSLPAEHKQTW